MSRRYDESFFYEDPYDDGKRSNRYSRRKSSGRYRKSPKANLNNYSKLNGAEKGNNLAAKNFMYAKLPN